MLGLSSFLNPIWDTKATICATCCGTIAKCGRLPRKAGRASSPRQRGKNYTRWRRRNIFVKSPCSSGSIWSCRIRLASAMSKPGQLAISKSNSWPSSELSSSRSVALHCLVSSTLENSKEGMMMFVFA